MAGVARAMKRHGLTSKPSLRLITTVRSGDVDYYMFDISDTGRKYTIAKGEFWRGATPAADLEPVTAEQPPPVPAASTAPAPAPEPQPGQPAAPPPSDPPPTTAPVAREYVRVRDMCSGDVVRPIGGPLARPREVVRVVPSRPQYLLHYVWEGTTGLRTAKVMAGAKFILDRKAVS